MMRTKLEQLFDLAEEFLANENTIRLGNGILQAIVKYADPTPLLTNAIESEFALFIDSGMQPEGIYLSYRAADLLKVTEGDFIYLENDNMIVVHGIFGDYKARDVSFSLACTETVWIDPQ